MTAYILGASGRLGRALAQQYANDGVAAIDRATYSNWTSKNSGDSISKYFEPIADDVTVIFVCAGLLDPSRSRDELFDVNFGLARNVVDGAAELGLKVVTFGTVMEQLPGTKNNYIQSKVTLAEHITQKTGGGAAAMHIQIHTLYGQGSPSKFMFLGQVLAALRSRTPFEMTSGKQLREYHHLEDEALAIRRLVDSAASGVIDLSHGRPVTLRDIAAGIFEEFDAMSLLKIGALPEPANENYQRTLQPTPGLSDLNFRDTIPSVIEYMKECHTQAHQGA